MELEFGKFKGRRLDDPVVTTKYLEWLYDQMVTTADAIQVELSRREQLDAGNSSLAAAIVKAGYFALVKETAETGQGSIQELAGARAALESLLLKYFVDAVDLTEEQEMQKQRERREFRNRAIATKILKTKDSPQDDIDWANKILNGH